MHSKWLGNADRIGIYGFGAAAYIVAQILRYQGRKLFVFTRPDDVAAQDFASKMGAAWVGDSDTMPPLFLPLPALWCPPPGVLSVPVGS